MSANGPSDDEIDRMFVDHGGKPLRAPTEAELQHMRANWPTDDQKKVSLAKDSPKELSPTLLQRIAKNTVEQIENDVAITVAIAVGIQRRGRGTPKAPPSTFLLDLLMAGSDGKDAAANLEDLLPYWEGKHGARKARLIFRVQVGYVLAGYWWNRGMNMVERVLNSVKVFTGIRGG